MPRPREPLVTDWRCTVRGFSNRESEADFRYYSALANRLRDELAGSPIHQQEGDPATAYRRLSLYERTWGLAVPLVLLRRLAIRIMRRLRA